LPPCPRAPRGRRARARARKASLRASLINSRRGTGWRFAMAAL
jgi:hypothetical protein